MKTVSPQRAHPKPVILNSKDETILRAVYDLHYVTALDITRLLFSKGSLTHVRSLLSRLAGGADHITNSYLYRFQLPTGSTGNREKVYALGAKGRNFLATVIGQQVEWYFRPYKLKYFSYSHVLHNLLLSRFVVAAHSWCRKQKDFRLVQTRLCYELARSPVTVENQGEAATLPVIPDAWLLVERVADSKRFPILLEIDKGNEHSKRLMRHVRSRIEFIRSGQYVRLFGVPAVIIAYATTGETPEYRDTRRRAMCAWTQEVLADLHMENWSHIFRFTSVVFDELYTTPMFDEPVWYRPDSPTPVPLLTPER